jgi:hypothetical protein
MGVGMNRRAKEIGIYFEGADEQIEAMVAERNFCRSEEAACNVARAVDFASHRSRRRISADFPLKGSAIFQDDSIARRGVAKLCGQANFKFHLIVLPNYDHWLDHLLPLGLAAMAVCIMYVFEPMDRRPKGLEYRQDRFGGGFAQLPEAVAIKKLNAVKARHAVKQVGDCHGGNAVGESSLSEDFGDFLLILKVSCQPTSPASKTL